MNRWSISWRSPQPSDSHWRERFPRGIVPPAFRKEAHKMEDRMEIANRGEVRLVSEARLV
jgi:hypothetical protein